MTGVGMVNAGNFIKHAVLNKLKNVGAAYGPGLAFVYVAVVSEAMRVSRLYNLL